jgi:hypothetical protein
MGGLISGSIVLCLQSLALYTSQKEEEDARRSYLSESTQLIQWT